MELHPGARLDRYVLVEPLGEGGQAAVWKAKDPLTPEQPRALKLMALTLSRPADAERVRREARALFKLRHPSLLPTHGLFEDLQHGVLGIVMDYVDGISLNRACDDARMGPPQKDTALRHIAQALAYVHDHGVVHRDLKLDNVLVTRKFWEQPDDPANLKLVDFGIATDSANPNPLTALDTVVGTLPYLAPELIDPARFEGSTSSPAVDVFAFGILAYKLFHGEHPTGLGPNRSLIDYADAYRSVARREDAWPPKVGGTVWGAVIKDCLRVHSTERLSSGTALAARLEALERLDTSRAPTSGTVSGLAPTVEHPALSPSGSAEPDPSEPAPAKREQVDDSKRPPNWSDEPAAESARSRTASGKILLALIASLGVVGAAVGLGIYLQGQRGHPPEPLASAAEQSASVTQLTPDPDDSGPVATDSETAAQPVGLPPDCDPTAPLCECCPSGRDCGGPCDDVLPSSERFALHFSHAKGRDGSLAAKHPYARVCVSRLAADAAAPTCFPLISMGSERPPLPLSGADLLEHGLLIEVADESVPEPLARAKLRGAVLRERLCKGLIVNEFEQWGVVEELVFYLYKSNTNVIPCSER